MTFLWRGRSLILKSLSLHRHQQVHKSKGRLLEVNRQSPALRIIQRDVINPSKHCAERVTGENLERGISAGRYIILTFGISMYVARNIISSMPSYFF